MAELYVNVNGTWKTASNYYVNVNGTWKEGSELHAKVSSAWKESSSGPAYDAAYSEFFSSNATPLNFDNSSYDSFTGSGSAGASGSTHSSLDAFFDHSQDKVWASYDSASYFTWNNGNNTYSGNANFYAVNSSGTNITGHSNLPSTNGRGITIAFLGDNTPVIVISDTTGKFYYFNHPAGTYIGRLTATFNTGHEPTNHECTGLAYDGTYLLASNQTNSAVFGYDMPANTTAINSGTITSSRKWSISHPCHYGMLWSGDGVYITNKNSNSKATYFRFSGSGTSGTSTNIKEYDLGSTNYSLGIDYKNRKLIMGGAFDNKYRVFGE